MGTTSRSQKMLPEALTSVIGGSIAGAVGVGVAYPLDTIKTKQQVEVESFSRIEYVLSPSGEISIVAAPSNIVISTVLDIWNSEGLAGFYGGVRTSMMGQAIIKATAFSVNTAALSAHYDLVYSAAIAGFVTAFLATPVDRIKVLMQTNKFNSEYTCFHSILKSEGVTGLLTTGLIPTFFREIPAYTLYFVLYGAFMSSLSLSDSSSLQTSASIGYGAIAPVISGALAGAICVIPVHPVDVVKTIVQHSAVEWTDVVADIYQGHGFQGFWEGLLPRMGRAAVNHAATFAVYEAIAHSI